MTIITAAWRDSAARHKQLLKELALILVACLVCFLYFNQQWLEQSEAQRRQAVTAIAEQLAAESFVPLSANNLVSLNVLVSQVAERLPVVGAELQGLDGEAHVSSGQLDGMRSLAVISDGGAQIIGKVILYSQPVSGLPFWPFFLLLLCLLGLRLAVHAFWRQLLPLPRKLQQQWQLGQAQLNRLLEKQPVATTTAEAPQAPQIRLTLAIRVSNHARLQQRLTPQALQGSLADYDRLLQQVAAIYGLQSESLDAESRLTLHHASHEEGIFLLACAACLYLICCQRLDQQRRADGAPCLQFSLLLHDDKAPQVEPSPQPFTLLLKQWPERLGERLHCQPIKAWEEDEQPWQLLALDALAERYQKLIAAQAESVISGSVAPATGKTTAPPPPR